MKIVQFMHPGNEMPVDESILKGVGFGVDWNIGDDHYRRLLCHKGSYVDAGNTMHKGTLFFWNEYEAPTMAYPTQHEKEGWEYARYYHKIVMPIPPFHDKINRKTDIQGNCCNNTDPCVFGDTFKYSNCQQVPNGDLWDLPEGSLILFGSHHGGEFYLDTVFVSNAPGRKYPVPIKNPPYPVSNDFRQVTLDNLRPRANNRTGDVINEFMFYRGMLPQQKPDGQIDGIYSFTPAKVLGSHDYFKRCKLDLAKLNAQVGHLLDKNVFSPELTQNHAALADAISSANVKIVWEAIKSMVLEQGFVLGTHFEWTHKEENEMNGNQVNELESQLHEQFAINNNNHANLLVTFIGIVAAIIGAYGYVFVHAPVASGLNGWGKFLPTVGVSYTFTTLLVAASAAMFILLALAIIALRLGAAARRDQFVTYAIRAKAYGTYGKMFFGKNPATGVFPKEYHPFNKKDDDFCIGIFGTFISMFNWVFLGIAAATVLRMPLKNIVNLCVLGDHWIPIVLFIATFLAYSIRMGRIPKSIKRINVWHHEREKYDELQKEYSSINPEEA